MKSLSHTFLHGITFGLGASLILLLFTLVYAATTYYADLPATSSGSTLSSTAWNNLVNYANKAVKQETEVMTITGGKVGIGTNTPSTVLHLSSNSSAQNMLYITPVNASWNTSNAILIDSNRPSANDWTFIHGRSQGNVQQFYVLGNGSAFFSGSVGIGTQTPGQKLTVAGTIESTSGGIKFPDGVTQSKGCTPTTAYVCTNGGSMGLNPNFCSYNGLGGAYTTITICILQ